MFGSHRLKQVYSIDGAVIKMNEGREEVLARYLKEYGENQTPIIVACATGKLNDVKVLLTSENINILEFLERNHGTPLMIATIYNHFDIAKYLIGGGADLTIVNKDKENVLHIAASKESPKDLIELLLDDMPLENINQKNVLNFTPLDNCYYYNNSPMRQEIIALIREKGGTAKSREAVRARYLEMYPRGTPLIVACEKGNLDDVKVLLTVNNKNVVGTDSRGGEFTPLMVAARFEHFQIVKYLIEQGEANPNIANSYGSNALHYPAGNNGTTTELIKFLLTHMSLDSINKENRGGYTPLDKAYAYNRSPIRQAIIALLRSKGGKANYYDENGNDVGEGNGDLNIAVLGTCYTLEEFKRIEFPKESLELKIPDGIEAAGCDFINEESPTLKMPVKVKVNDGNDFRWDVAGDKLFVFCAVELKILLGTSNFNPYNRRVIVGVQYLTEDEIKAEELKYTKKRQLEETAEVSSNKRQSKFLESLKF